MDRIEGKLSNGFEYSIPSENFDDMELLEVLTDIDEGKAQYIGKAFTMLLGPEKKKELYECIRREHGKVLATVAFDCFTQIMKSGNDQIKN